MAELPAPVTFEEMIDREFAKARAIMIRRHKKYGPKNIAKKLLPGVVTRLEDKLARLDVAVNADEPEDFDDETVEDTLADVANYGIIGMCVHDGYWTKDGCPPLAEEVWKDYRASNDRGNPGGGDPILPFHTFWKNSDE